MFAAIALVLTKNPTTFNVATTVARTVVEIIVGSF